VIYLNRGTLSLDEVFSSVKRFRTVLIASALLYNCCSMVFCRINYSLAKFTHVPIGVWYFMAFFGMFLSGLMARYCFSGRLVKLFYLITAVTFVIEILLIVGLWKEADGVLT
jgi:hypothetical protein